MFQVELRVERSLTWTLLGRCVTWRPRGRSPASRLVWEHLGVPLEELERVSEASLRMEIGRKYLEWHSLEHPAGGDSSGPIYIEVCEKRS